MLVPAESQPLPVPQEYKGRRRILNSQFPEEIKTPAELVVFISSRIGDDANFKALQQLAFTILHHTVVGPEVVNFIVEHYLKSFSKVTWADMLPFFRHSLDTSIFRDHRAIRSYRLQRSRLPIALHKSIFEGIEKSRRTLGNMNDLENEAAKQLYMTPIHRRFSPCFRAGSSTFRNIH